MPKSPRKPGPRRAPRKPPPTAEPAADVTSHPPETLITTQSALAKHFAVARRTVIDWCARPNFPAKREDGSFDVEAIAAWRADRLAATGQDPAPADDSKLAYWRVRKERALARRKELELRRLQESLIEVDEVVRLLSRHVSEARTHLAQLPDYLASLLPKMAPKAKREMRALIEARVLMIETTLAEIPASLEEKYATKS